MGWFSSGAKTANGAVKDEVVEKKGFGIKAKYDHGNLEPVELDPSKIKVKKTLVTKEEALPGRKNVMDVSDQHFVLKNQMKGPWAGNLQKCVFGNGCFWGSEKGIWRLPGGGIHSTAVGYAGGFTENPTYEEVCTGKTGHAEAVQVVFDPEKISLTDILRWFWESHDPTQGMAQGNDRGSQYRSILIHFNDEQRQLFEASKSSYENELKAMGKGTGKRITTEIKAAADCEHECVFFYAEDEHQQYLAKPGARPYCSAQPQIVSLRPFEEWAPAELREKFAPKLEEEFWRIHGPKPHCVIKAPHEPIVWSPTKQTAAKKKAKVKAAKPLPKESQDGMADKGDAPEKPVDAEFSSDTGVANAVEIDTRCKKDEETTQANAEVIVQDEAMAAETRPDAASNQTAKEEGTRQAVEEEVKRAAAAETARLKAEANAKTSAALEGQHWRPCAKTAAEQHWFACCRSETLPDVSGEDVHTCS